MTTEERLNTFLNSSPSVHPSAYIADSAELIGDVRIAENASVWPKCVLRGDINFIEVGEGSNIQDATVIHLADEHPVKIGKDVTIGHCALIHACTIEDSCLIGMRATIMDGAVIGKGSLVGAGALVTSGTVVPAGSLVLGSPAKIKRPLSAQEIEKNAFWAHKYRIVAENHKKLSNNN